MQIMKSVGSIIVGYLAFGVLVWLLWAAFGYGHGNIPPDNFHIVSLCCEIGIAVLAGYLAALVAGRKELLHVGILAVLFLILTLVGLFTGNHNTPTWITIVSIFVFPPALLLGGFLRIRQKTNLIE